MRRLLEQRRNDDAKTRPQRIARRCANRHFWLSKPPLSRQHKLRRSERLAHQPQTTRLPKMEGPRRHRLSALWHNRRSLHGLASRLGKRRLGTMVPRLSQKQNPHRRWQLRRCSPRRNGRSLVGIDRLG